MKYNKNFTPYLELKLLSQNTNSAPYSFIASHFTLAVHLGTTTVQGNSFFFRTGKIKTRVIIDNNTFVYFCP